MDVVKVRQLRRNLTLHFAVLAWLTAMLVATGSGSVFLPVLILLVSIAAYIFVDTLEWFHLGRVGSYLGMCTVTCISIGSYVYSAFYDSENGQLMAVAGMLVYPEAVLFLQRKNLRIYEQLAIFLLLEMVVAALVNDNLLFGLLLTPIMILWVSALFLFCRYATLVSLDPRIETPMPKLAEILFKRLVKSVLGESNKHKQVTSRMVASSEGQGNLAPRRLLQSSPIGIGALVFAGLFFYLLPRTSPLSFHPGRVGQPQVGLPTSLTFGNVGRILQNPTPVMRVSLTHVLDNEPYDVDDPPYLRALVFDTYGPSPGRSFGRGSWFSSTRSIYAELESTDAVRPLAELGRDLIHVEFDIKRDFVSKLFCVPPAFASTSNQRVPLRHDPALMLIEELDQNSPLQGKSLIYRIGSAAYVGGIQAPVIPARFHRLSRNRPPDPEENESVDPLQRGFLHLTDVDDYRRNLLSNAGVLESDLLRSAATLEQHFLTPGNFTYSLDLDRPTDSDLDPIQDFLLHQRRGHCQYFASAMVAMLRQTGIPSRIVVGYRPTERNEIGKYFLVRQSDAHAWVEGLFSRQDLVGTEYEKWLTNSENYWVRFDPTPAGDGGEREIVRQQGQAIDYAEKLWKDYIIDGQKLAGENSLYAPVAENSKNAYDGLVEKWNLLRDNIRAGRRWTEGISIGFAWPLAILTLLLGILGLMLWRLVVLLPKIAPRLARRLGMAKRESEVKQPFYARCLRLIEQLGIRRQSFETPWEFTQNATDLLSNKGQVADKSLSFLTAMYYRLRFSNSDQASQAEGLAIDAELRRIESAIAAARNNRTPPVAGTRRVP